MNNSFKQFLVKNYYFYFFSYDRYILLQNLSSQKIQNFRTL